VYADDFAQLQLQFVDHTQWRYEVIRPVVLFADRCQAYTPALPRARLRVKEWLHLIGRKHRTSDSLRPQRPREVVGREGKEGE
jgi:hypothetical protein